MPDFDTSRFKRLYDVVTADLKEYIREELSGHEAAWFGHLIDEFTNEYAKWNLSPPSLIEQYLYRLEEASVHPDVRLAGHVFLHIAYDLPRVLADTFVADRPIHISGRGAFIRPGSRFLKVFVAHLKSGQLKKVGRLLAVIDKIFGHADAMRILGFWVIALRTTAWMHAEVLAGAQITGVVHTASGPQQVTRAGIQDRMAMSLLAAAEEALKEPWVFGVPDLDNSRLVATAPIIGELTSAKIAVVAAVVAGVAAGIAVTNALRGARERQHLIATIEGFGAIVHRNMERAIDPDLPLPGDGRLDWRTRDRG